MTASTPAGSGQPWPELAHHRGWLVAEFHRLLDFAEASAHPAGGFAWLDTSGSPVLDRPVETYVTCRMTHAFALGHLLGRPGAGPLVDHGVAALRGRLRDDRHGGWFGSVGDDGPVETDKGAYAHAFVVLAAASATAAGRADAAELLDEALAVSEQRFWDDEHGLCVESWSADWAELERYRGVNANMHTVEAYLAAADVTGQPVWRERAARITERVLDQWARDNSWRIPEHFDEEWRADPEYNRDDPAHQFRPYGATIGHAMEWCRLALQLRASLGAEPPGWLLEAPVALFDRAVADGWAVDGADGFVYTTDWSGTPVVRDRLHWVVTEALGAAAALWAATGEDRYERWYREWWDHAARCFLDRVHGSWIHQLDPHNRPASTVWDGKPDTYHALQATLVPLLPLGPSFALALRDGLAR